ncbi:MAG TPA: lytic transglycosylase domain-containing protein [Thermoanaerobaculia bacterium]|nr:lytic transglycosylase domain-containing protein [Thermoanaerobaculia bacterium]
MIRLLAVAAVGGALLLGAWFAATVPEARVPPPRSLPATLAAPAAHPTPQAPPVLPPAQWTSRFRTLEQQGAWEELGELLDELLARLPALYEADRLGYLQARAARQAGDDDRAVALLAPFLAPGDPFRPLALHHAAELAAAGRHPEQAAAYRRQLLLEHPGSLYWQESLDQQLAWLGRNAGPAATLAFAEAALPLAGDERSRRALAAARVAGLLTGGEGAPAVAEGTRLLAASTQDDAAERVALLLDRPAILPGLSGEQLRNVGDSMLHHRRWDRAVELFLLARRELPRQRGELDFAMGRARFFAEQYADAERLYRRAALNAASRGDQARFLFHAARAAQLRGRDKEVEALLSEAIAVPGRFEATRAAITARIRQRVYGGHLVSARADLALLRRLFPRDRALAEGAVALAMGQLAAGDRDGALAALSVVSVTEKGRPGPFDAYALAEVAYWRARAGEGTDDRAALGGYLAVLRAEVPTHFAYLARHRLAREPLARQAAALAAERRRQARAYLVGGDAEQARQLQTDAVLLTGGAADDLALLARIYAALPAFRGVLAARPLPLPSFPLAAAAAPDELLAAMGLHDEAVDRVGERYPLTPFVSGLTRSVAYRLGDASRPSIQAVESLMDQVPRGFVPQLLPRLLRELLYPRYFYDWIAEDAQRYQTDPRLLLAIMREESRFNPRAKSAAAARGLMQLLLTTARQVAQGLGVVEVAPEDLYDPRLVIQLGAKYVADLQEQLGGDPYATAAAYNAGPAQAKVWLRLAPAAGHDYFLSTVSFPETRHYVRKVLNSYERYGEIYQGQPPTGGVRAEP